MPELELEPEAADRDKDRQTDKHTDTQRYTHTQIKRAEQTTKLKETALKDRLDRYSQIHTKICEQSVPVSIIYRCAVSTSANPGRRRP